MSLVLLLLLLLNLNFNNIQSSKFNVVSNNFPLFWNSSSSPHFHNNFYNFQPSPKTQSFHCCSLQASVFFFSSYSWERFLYSVKIDLLWAKNLYIYSLRKFVKLSFISKPIIRGYPWTHNKSVVTVWSTIMERIRFDLAPKKKTL